MKRLPETSLILLLCVPLWGLRLAAPVGGAVDAFAQTRGSSAGDAETRSTIQRGRRADLAWARTKLPTDQNIVLIKFLDKDTGWAASEGGLLFTTGDGGRRWRRLKIEQAAGSSLDDLHFSTRPSGWAVVSDAPPDSLESDGYRSRIFHTDDGGVSWRLQFQGTSVQLQRVRFFDDDEGWAVGSRFVGDEVQRTAPLILHTTNGGKDWLDVSAKLEEFRNTPDSDETIVDVHPDGPHGATLLSSQGNIFITPDRGQTWKKQEPLRGEPEQTSPNRLGVERTRSWVVGGAGSLEGTWGVISYRENGGPWRRKRTVGAYFSDATALPGNHFVACGTILSEKRGLSSGVVFLSPDAGDTWHVIFEDPQIKSINYVDATPGGIWAAGSGGVLLHLKNFTRGTLLSGGGSGSPARPPRSHVTR